MSTTIQISDNVKKNLDKMKIHERETYNDVIEVLLEDNMELSENTRKELKDRTKSPKLISHEEVKRLHGL